MVVIPLTSLPQFNSIVSSQWCPRAVQLGPPVFFSLCLIILWFADQREPRRRHLLLGVLVRPLPRNDANFRRRCKLWLACGHRFLQSRHRPSKRHRSARWWANGAAFFMELAYNKAHPLMCESRVHIDPWFLRVSARPEARRTHWRMPC